MRALAAVVLSCICLPITASAQSAPPRVRLSLNIGVDTIDGTTAQSFSVQKNLESAPIAATVAFKSAPLFDAGASLRVAGRFGVGVAVSAFSSTRMAAVTAGVPHPFFFNQLRMVSGGASIARRETATHVDATYLIPVARAVDVVASGGPTVFNISQPLVSDISYTDAYPFDTAAFASATTTRVAKTAVGYNVGADVTWRLSSHLGVGGLMRFARTTTTLRAGSGNSVAVSAGGLQAGGGLRAWF